MRLKVSPAHRAIRTTLSLCDLECEIEDVPLGAAAEMECDDDETKVSDEHAILRYISRFARTYPSTDTWLQAKIDMWLSRERDMMAPFSCPGVNKEWLTKHVDGYLILVEEALLSNHRHHGPFSWLAGTTESSTADFCWIERLRALEMEDPTISERLGPETRAYVSMDPTRASESDDDYATTTTTECTEDDSDDEEDKKKK